jgi:hypothetical protein
MLKNSSNSGVQSDKKLYVLNLVEKTENEAVKPYFKVLEKNEETEKWVDTGNQITDITGDLASVSVSSFEYKGDEIKKVNLLIVDEEAKEAYLIGLSFKTASRSLLNSLLSLENNKGVTIKVYRNKKGKVSFYTTQNGDRVAWKFAIEELPQPLEITHPKTGALISRDYSEVNDFFVAEIEKAADRLGIKFGDGKPKADSDKKDEPASEGSPKPSETQEEEELF